MCFSGQCAIEDLATDIEVNMWCHDYMEGKALYAYTEDLEVLKRMHERLGLYADPSEHLKIEEIYRKWSVKKEQESRGSTQREFSGSSVATPRRAKKLLSS